MSLKQSVLRLFLRDILKVLKGLHTTSPCESSLRDSLKVLKGLHTTSPCESSLRDSLKVLKGLHTTSPCESSLRDSLKVLKGLHTTIPCESLVLRGLLLCCKHWHRRWPGTLALEIQSSQNLPGKSTQNVQPRNTMLTWWNQIPSDFPPLTS